MQILQTRKTKKLLLKTGERGQKTVFDEDGEAHPEFEFESEAKYQDAGKSKALASEYLASQKELLQEKDVLDKETERGRLRARRLKRKLRDRALAQGDSDNEDDGDEDDGVNNKVYIYI